MTKPMTMKQIQTTMAKAIEAVTGQAVEVTHCYGAKWSVCGFESAVMAARDVMTAAGLTLTATETDADDFPGERWDYYTEAA